MIENPWIIFGFGKQGKKFYKALTKNGLNVGAVVDPAITNDASCNCVGFKSFEEFLFRFGKDRRFNLVLSCPVSIRHELIQTVLRDFDGFVVAEKPFLLDQSILNLISDDMFEKRVRVNFTFRFFKQFIGLRKARQLDNLVFGNIRISAKGDHQRWKHQLSSDGGIVNELAIHGLDLLFYLFGIPDHLTKMESGVFDSKRFNINVADMADDYCIFKVRYRNPDRLFFVSADFNSSMYGFFSDLSGPGIYHRVGIGPTCYLDTNLEAPVTDKFGDDAYSRFVACLTDKELFRTLEQEKYWINQSDNCTQ